MIFPRDMQTLINTGAIPMAPGDYTDRCPNCGGMQIVGCFQIKSGPYQSPAHNSKWLDMPDKTKSGWYNTTSHFAECPVCRGGHVPPRVINQPDEAYHA